MYRCDIGGKLSVSWYQNGLLHRENGPAYEITNEDGKILVWYTKGQLLRRETKSWADLSDGPCRWALAFLGRDWPRRDPPSSSNIH
jgi:hypothetical protein